MATELVQRLIEIAGPFDDPMGVVCREAASEIQRLNTALHLAAGLLSAMETYQHMSPDQVLKFLLAEANHDRPE